LGIYKEKNMRALVITTLLLAAPALSMAQQFGQPKGRAQSWDFSVGAIYQSGDSSSGQGGSSLDVKDELGLAFNIGYNFTSKLSLNADFDFLRPDFTAIIANEMDPNDTIRIDHTMSQFNGRIKGTLNFMDGPFTPYVELGLGWTYIDSNVADGPPITGCWWHPWWGYICSNFYNTFSGTETSYGGALGLRYEFVGGSFLRASYNLWNLDAGGSAAEPQLESVRLEYGWRF
jgi:opacity protein-like surface antigen